MKDLSTDDEPPRCPLCVHLYRDGKEEEEYDMGFSLRQKVGLLTVSWSRKRGVNLSVGAGGLRVGTNAKGSYISANASLGGLRYRKRVSLGTPQRGVPQAQKAPARTGHEPPTVVVAIVAALGFFGMFTFFFLL